MNKHIIFLLSALLLSCTALNGQIKTVSKKEFMKAVRSGKILNNPLDYVPDVDIVLHEPSFPTTNLWTTRDSTGAIEKDALDKISPKIQGDMYYFGRGIERDLDKAIECYKAASNANSTDWELHYIQYLKESPYLDIDGRLCKTFVSCLGEKNDYFEKVVFQDLSVGEKRERALAWAIKYFSPTQYTIESSDNSTKLIIKFHYDNNFWVPSTANPGTPKAQKLNSGHWYSFSGSIILDLKDDRHRIRITYPSYSTYYKGYNGMVIDGDKDVSPKKLMDDSRSKITSCLRYRNGIDISIFKSSKKIDERVFHENEQAIYDSATAFFTIMDRYCSIISSLEAYIDTAPKENQVDPDAF